MSGFYEAKESIEDIASALYLWPQMYPACPGTKKVLYSVGDHIPMALMNVVEKLTTVKSSALQGKYFCV